MPIAKPLRKPEVYFVEDVRSGMIKIGFADNARARLFRLQVGNPGELRLLAVVPTAMAVEVERHLHVIFAEHRGRGEWFAPSPELLRYVRCINGAAPREELLASVAFIAHDRTILWAASAHGLSGEEWERRIARASQEAP